jgi:hypothetical protein
METESSPGNVVLKYELDGVLDKNRTMDNVQKHNISTPLMTYVLLLLAYGSSPRA